MPRVTRPRVSGALLVAALVGKVVVSGTVGDTAGSWLGGVLAFASTVAFVLHTWRLTHPRETAEGDEAPPGT